MNAFQWSVVIGLAFWVLAIVCLLALFRLFRSPDETAADDAEQLDIVSQPMTLHSGAAIQPRRVRAGGRS